MIGRPTAILALAMAFLLATACASDDKSHPALGTYHLASMVLPAGDLHGSVEVSTLEPLSRDLSNEVAAESSLDPNDTQESLASAGRLDGFALVFPDERNVVATRVDLWKDADAASRGMEQMIKDFEHLEGKPAGSVLITDVDRFPVAALGDESWGLRILGVEAGESRYQTMVIFRVGRIVGFAIVNRDMEADDTALTMDIARKLEARVSAVVEGSISPPIIGIGPSLEHVRSAMDLELLSEERKVGELSQLFERADPGTLLDSASILFPGDDGAVTIDLARFETEGAAMQAWEKIKGEELESEDIPGRVLEIDEVGDRSVIRVYPPSPGNEFVTTVVLVHMGQVVYAATALSHDPGGLSQGVQVLAGVIETEVTESGLNISGPYE